MYISYREHSGSLKIILLLIPAVQDLNSALIDTYRQKPADRGFPTMSWPLSSKSSLSCLTCCVKGHPILRSSPRSRCYSVTVTTSDEFNRASAASVRLLNKSIDVFFRCSVGERSLCGTQHRFKGTYVCRDWDSNTNPSACVANAYQLNHIAAPRYLNSNNIGRMLRLAYMYIV